MRGALTAVLLGGAMVLSGCATTTGGRGGSALGRVFVPPPPAGGGSSTITVVPAKSGRKAPQEKSWGKTDTPGGSASAAPGTRSPAVADAASGSASPIRSLYDAAAARPHAAQGVRPAPAKTTAGQRAGTNVPVPVLYQAPAHGDSITAPASDQEDFAGEYDPRLSS